MQPYLTMRTYIGALFMMGIPGPELDKVTKEIIIEFGIGGIILFSKNIKDPFQLASLCKELQDISIKAHKVPLFIGIDQEGGRVSRLNFPFTQFPGNIHMANTEDPIKEVDRFAKVVSHEMSLVGINMNMAPVLDVCYPCPEFLKERSFGDDPNKVAMLGEVIIKRFYKERIICVGKHFPGLGLSNTDPHHELPVININYDELKNRHIYPFKRAISAGVPCIMVSHAIYTEIDPDLPISISPKAVKILRKDLGFNGVIITDDMEMGAIKKKWKVSSSVIKAIKAGVNIILICKSQTEVVESILILQDMVKEGDIPYKKILDSYYKVIDLKKRFHIWNKKVSFKEIKEYFGK